MYTDHHQGAFYRIHLIARNGAHHRGERSNGTMRAEGWNRIPLVRMTNISILPGEKPLTFDQLIAGTDDGIFMQTNRSWSIDDKRYNFQFGCEIGWEIKGGKLGACSRTPRIQESLRSSGTPWTQSAHAINGPSGVRPTAAKASPCRQWGRGMARPRRDSGM